MANVRIESHSELRGTAVRENVAHLGGAAPEGHGEPTVVPPGDSSAVREKTRVERDELLDRMARMQAEFENARKRLAREQNEFKEFALADTITSLLPVLDGLDWALQTPYQNVEEFRSGISLIRKQLEDFLSSLGLRPIAAKGEPFDPRVHEAVEVVNTEVAPDNQVLKDVRRGYKLKDRLLRPAMVLVSRNPASHNPENGADGEKSKPAANESSFAQRSE
jgi:molecular chaperone GrpE